MPGGAPGDRSLTSGNTFGIRRRRAAEGRFKFYGVMAISIALIFLTILLGSIISKGYKGFLATDLNVEIDLQPSIMDPNGLLAAGSIEQLRDELQDGVNFLRFSQIIAPAVYDAAGVDPSNRDQAREVRALVSRSAPVLLRDQVLADPTLIGQTLEMPLLAGGDVDAYLKGYVKRETPEQNRRLTDYQLNLVDDMVERGAITQRFNTELFTNTTSKRPEAAGLGVALIGSFYMMIVVLAVALPIGVAASIYLEEFAPKNTLTDAIEVNINNLAAVPSIVFGILGLAVFINWMGLPNSAPLVGGLVLSLMTLPTIIIATRASLKAVPPSIREAALGVGASKMQSVFHHVLPLALPGILTGTIIGLAQALGETAPLLMVGMDAFVTRYPELPTDPATSLPSQIYNWAREDDRNSFDPKTSAAIMVLLMFLAIMNFTAVLLRKRFERRW
ncbi:MAG: phosphate ABC transporter permease PstA [Pseudomonadota bacterium]